MTEPDPLPPLLQGRSVRLEPVDHSDEPWLRRLLCNGDALSTWRFRGVAPPPELLLEVIRRDVLAQFVLRGPEFEGVGLVQAYQPDLRNRHVRLSLAVDPAFEGSGLAFDGVLLFLGFLMANWEWRHIYIEGPAPTLERMGAGLRGLVVEEARMRESEYFLGTWVDHLIWTIHVPTLPGALLERLREPARGWNVPSPRPDLVSA